MFLLVPVHAAGLLALNGNSGAWATAIYWVVHVFRLPLFFAMSGFFLALLLSRKGVRETMRNRTVRIVVPLLLGMLTLVPLTALASRETGTALTDGGGAVGIFGLEPSFLWFLWYLLIIDCAAVALYLLGPRLLQATGESFRRLIEVPVIGILVLAVPTALSLLPAPAWTISPPAETFVPDPVVLFYYALFFGLGATICTHRELISSIARNAWLWAGCALAATVPAGLLFALHNSPEYGSQPLVHAAGVSIYAIATWASLMALVGLADRYLNRPSPTLRYLADSSYWTYLSHMPAMVLLIAVIGATTLGTWPRFALVTAGSLAFSLLTYPVLVRYTVVGRILNGRRQRRRPEVLAPKPTLRGASG